MSDRLTDEVLSAAAAAFGAVLAEAGLEPVVVAHIVAEPDGECAGAANVDRDRVGPEGFMEVLANGLAGIARTQGLMADVARSPDPEPDPEPAWHRTA